METTLLNSIFVGLKPNQLQEIQRLAIRRNYQRGWFIFYQGEMWTYLLSCC